MWAREVDFVSIGSGLGGLTAALAAHEKGAEAIVLEKAPKLGGVCAYSGGEVFVWCNHLMAKAGSPDDPVKARAYLDFIAGGYSDPALADILFTMGPKVAQWAQESCGVQWQIIQNFPDYYYPKAPGTVAHGRYLEPVLFEGASLGLWQKKTYFTPHMPPGISHDELFAWGGLSAMARWNFATMGKRIASDIRGMGPAMMGWFVKACLERRIEMHVNSPVTQLIQEGGRVVGVVATLDGKPTHIRARKGVLVAVGGYDWNPEMAKHFEGLPDWNSMCQPHMTGDNIVLGGELGAALAGVPSYNLGMFFGYQVPGEMHDGKPLWRASWECGYPHAILVNRDGKRFADESFYRDYLPRCHDWNGVQQRHPNYPPVLIFDQNYRDKYAFCSYMPGQPVPETLLKKGATLRELAEKLEVDPAGLEATVERFNSFADGAVDPDFGRGTYPWAAMMTGDRARPNPNMGPLNKAPYYGVKLTAVGVGVNAVGLKTNAHGQVLHVRGNPIEGLYAAGNSAALLDVGAGYQSGISNIRGMTWAYLAARHAMGA